MKRFLVLVPLLAMGCAVGPDYERPKIQTPTGFRDAPAQPTTSQKDAVTFGDLPWWNVFGDDVLQHLVADAATNNLDLRSASARVEIARQQARAVGADLLPGIGLQGGGGAGQGGLGYPQFANQSYAVAGGFTLNWELDVWGRIRRARESAVAQYLASEEVRRAVWVTLLGDIATSYFDLRSLDLQLDLATQNLTLREQTLQVFEQRKAGGVGNDLEVQQQRASVAQARGTVAEVKRRISLSENALSLLLGHPPDAIPRGLTLVAQTMPPDVPVGLPSTLLERRPDVRAAEELLRSANAEIGVALASYFPSFNLNALAGIATSNIIGGAQVPASPVTNNGVYAAYSGGGLINMLLPFLQGQKLSAQYAGAKAQYEAAQAEYEKAALLAFKEVADALVNILRLKEVRIEQEKQVEALIKAASVANDRYQGGQASYLEVITAQQALLPAQLGLAQTQANQLDAVVALYRALGGGWGPPPPP